MVIRACKPGDAEPGKSVCLYTRDGKRLLGRHPNKRSAYLQEAAIKASQARRNPDEPNIHVLSRLEAEDLLDEGAPDEVCSVISITDPERPEARFIGIVEEQDVDLAVLSFEDEDKGEPGAPTEQDIRVIVEFLRATLADLPEGCMLLIHCEAGMARSTSVAAMAWALCCPELSNQEIAERVHGDRPGAWPNRYMLKLAAPMVDRENLEEVQDEIYKIVVDNDPEQMQSYENRPERFK